MLTNPTFG
ncbi:hypothetical protein AYI68_g7346, partial [Smittium mucronatum]